MPRITPEDLITVCATRQMRVVLEVLRFRAWCSPLLGTAPTKRKHQDAAVVQPGAATPNLGIMAPLWDAGPLGVDMRVFRKKSAPIRRPWNKWFNPEKKGP